MTTYDLSGYWTGDISGTNRGGFSMEIKQEGVTVAGIAKMQEPSIGMYEYTVLGDLSNGLAFRLLPVRQRPGLGVVQVICKLEADGSLTGRWKSDVGTEGVFTAKRYPTAELSSQLPTSNSVFLVHGHDEGAMHSVARFLEQIGTTPVILQEQINRGMTVVEKFEDFAARAGFAVVLMTPDDVGYPIGKEENRKLRPRQNVVLELGYFAAKLGRSKTLVLVKGDMEIPSDVVGLVYEPMDKGNGWKMRLAQELNAAGFTIDMNKAI